MIPELRLVARTRRHLEALDLGLTLLRAHRGAVMAVFGLQLGILLALILPFTWRHPAWALVWLWWLTPWLHRGTLHVLSRRVFGMEAGVMTFLEDAKKIHRHGFIASLLWRRLSPSATFLLPIWQLEEPSGHAFRMRARVLLRQVSGHAALLTLVSFVLMVLSLFGALGLLQSILPRTVSLNLWHALTNAFGTFWFSLLFTGFGVFALVVVEPMYAASGFALYLGARTNLEGWDLEQVFRRMAQRLRNAAVAIFLLLSLAGIAQGATPAAPASSVEAKPRLPDDPARKQMERLLQEAPDLQQNVELRSMHYRPTGREPKWLRKLLDWIFGSPQQPESTTPRPMPAWWTLLAWLAKALLVAALVALVLWIVVRFKQRRSFLRKGEDTYVPPEALAGLDIRPESLPDDVAGAALARFRAGDPRGALALLYRGTLAALVHGYHLEIPASATEGDCLRLALPALPEAAATTLKHLTTAWIHTAYVGETPEADAMDSLCQGWRATFGSMA